MIIDTSAIIAILRDEDEALFFAEQIAKSPINRISCASYLEASIVIDAAKIPVASRQLDNLIAKINAILEPVTPEQAKIAREAYRDYGKGTGHKAQLNYGDCFSYALAFVMKEPILFKGDDFNHTDLQIIHP